MAAAPAGTSSRASRSPTEMRARAAGTCVWLGARGGHGGAARAAARLRDGVDPRHGRARQGPAAEAAAAGRICSIAFWRERARIIRRIRPDVVLGLGGYVAFPGGMMASLLGRPLALHEQNAIAGLANRVLARVADKVMRRLSRSALQASARVDRQPGARRDRGARAAARSASTAAAGRCGCSSSAAASARRR